FGFEHRTFSESPIENALALASALPAGTRLHIVSHSRGGLVGDLMCLDAAAGELDTLIDLYRHELSPDEKADKEKEPRLRAAREAENARMQARLRQLVALLREKHIQVERYVRVAAPARGTALLSDNLDVFLSCLLNLVRRFGGWAAGLTAGAVAGPAAGLALRTTADRALAFLTRVVLEIADKR